MKTTLKWLFGLGVLAGAAVGACYLAHKAVCDGDCDCEEDDDFDFDNDNFYTTKNCGLDLDENKYQNNTKCDCSNTCCTETNKEPETKDVENVVKDDYKVVINERAGENKEEVKADETPDAQPTTELVDNEKAVDVDTNKEPETKPEEKEDSKKDKKEKKKKD